MKMMNTLILVLFISSLGLVQQATSQDVEIRGAGVGDAQADLDGSASGAGGGQSRTIYSQRHLSPHRMMHFGKRPANIPPPTLREVYDLYPVQQQQHQVRQQQLQRRSAASMSSSNYLPFQFSLLLDNGQTLRAVPEDTLIPQPAASLAYPIMNRNSLQYSYEPAAHNQLTFAPFNEVPDEQSRQQQQLMMRQLFNGQLEQRLSKLMLENDESKSSNSEPTSNSAGEVSSENSSPERASDSNQQQQSQQQDSININTRSMHPSGRANTLSLPKAYFSSLYGRQGSASMPSYSNYNKKAEPKENFFMHFGRK